MPQKQCSLLIRRKRRFNIGRYTFLVNHLFARRVIFCRGQPKR